MNQKNMDYYQDEINEYKAKAGKCGGCSDDPVIQYVMEQKTLGDAIAIAAKSTDKSGKRHSHQRRIQNEIMEIFAEWLISVKDKIQNAQHFDELFETIKGNKIKGIGELLVYDTALRLGHFLNIFPEKIYLHSGTRVGIEKLLGKKIDEEYLLKENLPEPFCSCDLTPYQLEDFFCVYKDAMLDCAEWRE